MAEEGPIFESVVQKMVDFGLYDYVIPFILTSAIMFALLRKSRVIGDSVVLNGVFSVSVGLLIFAFPVLTGITYGQELSTFFVQGSFWIFILVLAVLIASVFYPDITKMLMDQMKTRQFLFIMMAMGIAIFVVSGMVSVFLNLGNPAVTGEEPELPSPPTDIVIIIASLIIFMVLLVIAAAIYRK